MNPFNWNEAARVYIHEIDTQHQRLMQLMNELSDAMDHDREHEVIEPIVHDLADYTRNVNLTMIWRRLEALFGVKSTGVTLTSTIQHKHFNPLGSIAWHRGEIGSIAWRKI